MIKEAIQDLLNYEDLSLEMTKLVMDEIMSGRASNAQIAAFMSAMRMKGETIDFESMITSIEVVEGRDIGSMTVYKFGKIFDRIAQFKNYDITVLYSMLDGRKIYPWYQTIQQTEPEEQYITEEQ